MLLILRDVREAVEHALHVMSFYFSDHASHPSQRSLWNGSPGAASHSAAGNPYIPKRSIVILPELPQDPLRGPLNFTKVSNFSVFCIINWNKSRVNTVTLTDGSITNVFFFPFLRTVSSISAFSSATTSNNTAYKTSVFPSMSEAIARDALCNQTKPLLLGLCGTNTLSGARTTPCSKDRQSEYGFHLWTSNLRKPRKIGWCGGRKADRQDSWL